MLNLLPPVLYFYMVIFMVILINMMHPMLETTCSVATSEILIS